MDIVPSPKWKIRIFICVMLVLLVSCTKALGSVKVEPATNDSNSEEFYIRQTAVISSAVFILGNLFVFIRRRQEYKDAELALKSEFRANINAIKQIFINIKSSSDHYDPDFLIMIFKTRNTLEYTLSSNVFKKMDLTHLRRTRLIEIVILIYSNMEIMKSCNDNISISRTKSLEAREYMFKLLTLCLQCEATLKALEKKRGDKNIKDLLLNINFYTSTHAPESVGLIQTHEVKRSIFNQLQEVLEGIRLPQSWMAHIGKGASEPKFSTIKSIKIRQLIDSLDDEGLKNDYIAYYNWITSGLSNKLGLDHEFAKTVI